MGDEYSESVELKYKHTKQIRKQKTRENKLRMRWIL